MATNTYYVKAALDPTGNFADCSYYFDAAATQPAGELLHIGQTAGACVIAPATGSTLRLVGSVFKTLGHAPVLNGHNFAPTDDEGRVSVAMPTDQVVTKGVVLMFANPTGALSSLYPGSDPQIINDE
jgi:hypothetical protein